MKSNYSDLTYFLDSKMRLHIYLGPMGLVITAKNDGESIFVSERAINRTVSVAIQTLEDVAGNLDIVTSWCKPLDISSLPKVVKKMVESALIGQEFFGEKTTPLISVAGSISDCILEELESEAEYIIINNYGDIALRVERAKIGLLDAKENLFGVMEVDNSIGGICTSGFRGRSFSKGISEATVCINKSASLADTFATLIGNRVVVDSPKIKYEYAENLDPLTDIRGEKVVMRHGELSNSEIRDAIINGLSFAKKVGVATIIKLDKFVGIYPKKIKKLIKLEKDFKFLNIKNNNN